MYADLDVFLRCGTNVGRSAKSEFTPGYPKKPMTVKQHCSNINSLKEKRPSKAAKGDSGSVCDFYRA